MFSEAGSCKESRVPGGRQVSFSLLLLSPEKVPCPPSLGGQAGAQSLQNVLGQEKVCPWWAGHGGEEGKVCLPSPPRCAWEEVFSFPSFLRVKKGESPPKSTVCMFFLFLPVSPGRRQVGRDMFYSMHARRCLFSEWRRRRRRHACLPAHAKTASPPSMPCMREAA